MADAIATRDLRFHYTSDAPILDGVNLNVPAGSIYGFLGVNGAGKSTTIRTLLGLIQPTDGQVYLFGQPLTAALPQALGRIGALIEAPSLYSHLNAVDHLQLACTYQQMPFDAIPGTLREVGLYEHRRKRVKAYSLGMKQRLGLAMALVHRPALLILDEPTNGLDPKGVSEMRALLRRLAAGGTTIMLSSHVLSEVEKMATHVGILHEGQVAFQGTLTDLAEHRGSHTIAELRVGSASAVLETLSTYRIDMLDAHTLRVHLNHEDEVPALIRRTVAAGHDVYAVQLHQQGLEQLFMSLTEARP